MPQPQQYLPRRQVLPRRQDLPRGIPGSDPPAWCPVYFRASGNILMVPDQCSPNNPTSTTYLRAPATAAMTASSSHPRFTTSNDRLAPPPPLLLGRGHNFSHRPLYHSKHTTHGNLLGHHNQMIRIDYQNHHNNYIGRLLRPYVFPNRVCQVHLIRWKVLKHFPVIVGEHSIPHIKRVTTHWSD